MVTCFEGEAGKAGWEVKGKSESKTQAEASGCCWFSVSSGQTSSCSSWVWLGWLACSNALWFPRANRVAWWCPARATDETPSSCRLLIVIFSLFIFSCCQFCWGKKISKKKEDSKKEEQPPKKKKEKKLVSSVYMYKGTKCWGCQVQRFPSLSGRPGLVFCFFIYTQSVAQVGHRSVPNDKVKEVAALASILSITLCSAASLWGGWKGSLREGPHRSRDQGAGRASLRPPQTLVCVSPTALFRRWWWISSKRFMSPKARGWALCWFVLGSNLGFHRSHNWAWEAHQRGG